MSKISIEEIREQLKQDNWELVSDIYYNLDTNLEYKCNEGHTVIAPWKKIRARRECPLCVGNTFKVKDFKNQKKKKGEFRILAFDQASYTSGYSLYSNRNLIDYGTYTVTGNSDIERIGLIKQWMVNLINIYEPDIVGFEGIQYQTGSGVTTFEVLARLAGVLLETCWEMKVPFKVVHTKTWKSNAGVKGKTRVDQKRSMRLIVKNWFGIDVSEDAADAIGIGKYFSDTETPKVEIIDWENQG